MVASKPSKSASALRTKCPKEKEDLSRVLEQCNQDARSLCESLVGSPDFQTQIDVLQKWTSPDSGVYFQCLASLFFCLPLKSSLRRSISCKVRHTPERDLLTSCFLHEIKGFEGAALVSNVIKCFDDNNAILMELAKHLPIQSFLGTISGSWKAGNEAGLSEALRALSYARLGARKSLLDGNSLFSSLCHKIITSSHLSTDTRGKAAKILISEEILRKKDLHQILRSLDEPKSPYFCSAMDNRLVYLNGIVTSTSCPIIIKKITEEYIQISAQNHDLDVTSVIILSRGILRCLSVLSSNAQPLCKEDIGDIEHYIWNYLEYPSSSVRYNVKDTLKEYIKIKCNSKSLEDVVNTVLSWGNFDKRRYTVLIPLVKIGGSELISLVLNKEPTFQKSLIANLSDGALRSSITELYRTCLSVIKDSDSWAWLKPVVDGYKMDTDNVCRKNHLDVIFKEVIKTCNPSIGDVLINDILHSEGDRSPFSLCIVLQSLKAMKMYKGSKFQFDNFDFVRECLTDFSDEVRLEALDFLCTSLKTSEVLNDKELTLIFEYGIKGNMLLSDASIQMHFLAIIKKLLGRINEGFGACKRRNDELTMAKYQATLKEMKKWILFDNLSRPKVHVVFRTLGFEIVLMCLELLHGGDVLFRLNCDEGRVLVECLKTETHDKNCEVILEILRKSFSGRDDDIVQFSIESVLDRVQTPRPRDGAVACYLTKVLRIYQAESAFEKAILEEFKRQLNVAKDSLIKASFQAPLYGVLGCLKGGPFMESIMEDCHELWALVSPIVNDSSPEGFSQKDGDGSMDCDPQLLLLLAWRTTKEICDIFEATASLQDTTSVDILKTCRFFIQVFSETKHRGVFERAYSGFCTISKLLWTHEDEKIRQFPGKLLEDTLGAISSVGEETTVTRRSAGYPFLIQALLSSQPGMGSFDSTMETLLEWSLSTSSNASLKVHACNILRAIYKDSSLGDKVMKYISKGLIAAILGFNSDIWPIRNASTLLFSSLITRLFGVKRDQDDLSEKNGVYTFKLFFERFPDLNDFLLHQLEDKRLTTYNCTTVFPSLLILAKLKTMSSPPSVKVASQLQNFIDRIMSLLSNPVLKIRHLASYALTALSSEKTTPALANSLIESLLLQSRSSNALHGILYTLHLMILKDPQIRQAILPNLQDKLSAISIQSPIILIEKLKLLSPSFYVTKDTLKHELTQRSTTMNFPHPGSDLYQHLLMEKALELAVDSRDGHLLQFLRQHNQPLYFETLTTKYHDEQCLDNLILCLNKRNMADRIASCRDMNEFLCYLKLFVKSNEVDNASEPIWNKTLAFLDSMDHQSPSFFCLSIQAMTKYVNTFDPSYDKMLTWASRLRSISLNEDDELIRRITIDSIAKSVSFIKPLNDPDRALVSLTLWSVLLTLSMDGDRSIQKSIYSVLTELWGGSYRPIILPDQVHAELVQWLLNNSSRYMAETEFVLLQSFEEIRDMSAAGDDGPEEEGTSLAFEKGNDAIRYGDIEDITKKIRQHYCDKQLNHKDFKLEGFPFKL